MTGLADKSPSVDVVLRHGRDVDVERRGRPALGRKRRLGDIPVRVEHKDDILGKEADDAPAAAAPHDDDLVCPVASLSFRYDPGYAGSRR